MSYVAKVSRGWDEQMLEIWERMMSQPNAKGEMYILNDGIDMKVKIAAMARRLEELEMKNMQEVQAISQTPLQPMPCSICRSYEHLPPQYQQPAQAPQQASNLEQAMMNLNKVMEDFVGAQKSIDAQLSQRINSVESSLIKRMDEVQNDLSQKIDNLQDSISSIHEMEAKEGEPSQKREVKEVITLRSGKEVDLPTCKLEHKVESETEKEKRKEIKGKKKGKCIEKDGYDVNVQREPQRIVIKEELMKKHMPPPFLQALYGKIVQTKSQSFWMISSRRKCKEIERKSFGAKTEQKQGKNKAKQGSARFRSLCEIDTLLRNQFATSGPSLRKFSQLRNHFWHTSATSQHRSPHFAAAKTAAKLQSVKNPNFAAKAPFCRVLDVMNNSWLLFTMNDSKSELKAREAINNLDLGLT
ncbi:hypothetical protein CK203_087618 [Vitis vinifera]|uniref:Uncharacterized protein n=1 Tax=Vitis vinifera TaxID=29760 RepID=A0A438C765_VITVI|nr:hypothetical protein CK203_087618 [Vitis vinifera]